MNVLTNTNGRGATHWPVRTDQLASGQTDRTFCRPDGIRTTVAGRTLRATFRATDANRANCQTCTARVAVDQLDALALDGIINRTAQADRVGQRGPVQYHQARPGWGTAYEWSRRLYGQHYRFTLVLMPDGELRWAAARLRAGYPPSLDGSWTILHTIIRPALDGGTRDVPVTHPA